MESLARPGGNATGISFYNPALGPKRLDLLREMLPKVKTVAFLVNPRNPNVIDTEHLQAAAHLVGVRMAVVGASSERELEGAFADAVRRGADALIVHTDALFHSRSQTVVALAARHALPAMWSSRRFVASGGLISYGTNIPEMYRQAGVYLGRILEGEEPADLPVLQPTKFELVIT